MSNGIPRLRTSYSWGNTKSSVPFAGTRRINLGRLFLEVTPGELTPLDPNWGVKPFIDVMALSSASGKCCRDELHHGPPYTSGGPFSIVKMGLSEPRIAANGHFNSAHITRTFWGLGTGRVHYIGGFHPDTWFNGLDLPGMLTGEMFIPSTQEWESMAYKRTKPKIERASGFVFAAEARDIPRMLKNVSRNFHDIWKEAGGQQTKLMSRDRIADNFLNHQFGWVPFISDMRKFYSTYQNAAAAKAGLTARNDKWSRRRVLLDKSGDKQVVASGNGMLVSPAGDIIGTLFASGATPTWELTKETTSVVQAVGSYKYYRPEFDANLPDYNSAWTGLQRDLTLYGARVTPSNIYRATPWTWLADWFTDFGDNIDNLTDLIVDGLVSRYLFVMRHVETKYTLTQRLPFHSGPQSLAWDYIVDAKVRREAPGPYGFGLTWKMLSPRQLAILAALKVTH